MVLQACSLASPGGTPGRKQDPAISLPTVDRTYGEAGGKLWGPALTVLRAYGFRISSDRHDGLGGELYARRGDGLRLHLVVTTLGDAKSRISMQVEQRTRELAQLILDRIAERLGGGEVPIPFLGGDILEDTYSFDWPVAMAAAETCAKALGFRVTAKVLGDSQAMLDARSPESIPVRFQVTRHADFPTWTNVTFIAGARKTPEAAALVARIKAEFDRDSGAAIP